MIQLCKLCRHEYPMTMEYFYRSVNNIKTGVSNVCKKCYIKRANSNKNHKLFVKRYEVKNDKTEKRKKQLLETAKRMYKKYPEKYKARATLHYHVKTGKIKKLPCEICGEIKVQAHHHKGYEEVNALKVQWLCMYHHTQVHHYN